MPFPTPISSEQPTREAKHLKAHLKSLLVILEKISDRLAAWEIATQEKRKQKEKLLGVLGGVT